jgi:hypothetical protein
VLATGLSVSAADGAMCVDAVQLAEPALSALIEFGRLLAPGGRGSRGGITAVARSSPADRTSAPAREASSWWRHRAKLLRPSR